MSRLSTPALALAALAALSLSACLDHPVKQVEYETVSVLEDIVEVYGNRNVDILFVIDNSGSMAEEQALLAKNFQAFIGELDKVDANYRIGIVTTDNGNPRNPGSKFDGGDFRLSSCLDRLSADGGSGGDFIYGDFNAEFACTDHCALHDADIAIRPTTTDVDRDEAPRPWLESLYGVTNLPEAISVADAFQCFGPQGVTGSGFESPLESMYRALDKADDVGSANHGFLRSSAHLAVVFITDEVDCSFNPEHIEIFQDNKAFWSDPELPLPTSAVCWNAGVQCMGSGPGFEGCEPADYDVSGAMTMIDDDAVLYPVSRYAGLLEAIRGQKQAGDPSLQVMVAAIAGVPTGYEAGGVAIPYAESADPEDQREYWIGPGCTFNLDDGDPSNDSLARPPVRLRELAEAFQVDERPGLYSICQDDYSGVLADLGERIKDQLQPACVRACVKDMDPKTPQIDPKCSVNEVLDGESEAMATCVVVDGELAPPTGKTACYSLLLDSSGETSDPLDDMTKDEESGEYVCASQGFDVEIKIVRTAPPRSGSEVRASCVLEENARDYCPDLAD